MLNNIKIAFTNKVLGKDIRIVTLDTNEKTHYEIHRADGSKRFGTEFK